MKKFVAILLLMGVTFLFGWLGHTAYSHNPASGVQWEFVDAARRGDLRDLQSCFARGAQIDAVPMGDNGFVSRFPALLQAAQSGESRTVEWLLAHGANPNLKNSDGYPLDAAEYRLTEVNKTVAALKEHGAKSLYPKLAEP